MYCLGSISSLMGYHCRMAVMRWLTLFVLVYFMTKLSTTRVKKMFLLVFEESLCVGLDIIILFEMGNQIVMRYFSSFLQTVPCTFYFSIDVAISNLFVEVIVFDNFLGDEEVLEVYLLSIRKE